MWCISTTRFIIFTMEIMPEYLAITKPLMGLAEPI